MVPIAFRTSMAAPSRDAPRELAGGSAAAKARSIKRRTSPRFTFRLEVRGKGASNTRVSAGRCI